MMPRPRGFRRRHVAPLALAAGATVLYVVTGQRALFSDGIFFVRMVERGQWLYGHLLYLPVVHALRLVVTPLVSMQTETLLKLLSALAAGAGVAIGYSVALAVLGAPGLAVAAAALLAVLPGYWFFATATEVHALHGACAGLFLLGLIRWLNVRDTRGWRSALVFGSAVLTPASHASGMAALLPALYTCWRLPGQRVRAFVAAVLPLLLFIALYLGLYFETAAIHRYGDTFNTLHAGLLRRPARIPGVLKTGAMELLLYAVPASTLLPAGLRVIYRRAPAVCGLCLVWIFAWPLLTFPVAIHEYGSYYVPSFFVQATAAIAAFSCIARSSGRAALAVLLSLLPGLVRPLGDGIPLGTYVVAATILLALCGDTTERFRARFLLLPAAALVFSAAIYVPRFPRDPVRDRIRQVAAITGRDSILLLIERNAGTSAQWIRYFPHRSGSKDLVNLVSFYLLPANKADASLVRLRARVDRAMRAGRPIYVVGPVGRLPPGPVPRFLQHLAAAYQVSGVRGGPPQLFRLSRRAPPPRPAPPAFR